HRRVPEGEVEDLARPVDVPVFLLLPFAAVQFTDLVGAVDHDVDRCSVESRDPFVFGDLGLDPTYFLEIGASNRWIAEVDTIDRIDASALGESFNEHCPDIARCAGNE